MSSLDLVKALVGKGDRISYAPYDISKIQIMYGAPPVALPGFDYVRAWRANPPRRNVMSLTGKGVFVHNLNMSGFVEIGFQDSSISCVAIDAASLLGIPVPIVITDRTTSGLSTVVGTGCELIETPAWTKAKKPELTIYRFAATRLIISHGVRDTE